MFSTSSHYCPDLSSAGLEDMQLYISSGCRSLCLDILGCDGMLYRLALAAFTHKHLINIVPYIVGVTDCSG